MTRYLKQINLLIIFLFCSFKLFSLPFVNQNYDYYVDLPEGYQVEEIDENLIFENQESLDRYVCSLYRIDYNSFKATLQ